jgi:hypothetical protein
MFYLPLCCPGALNIKYREMSCYVFEDFHPWLLLCVEVSGLLPGVVLGSLVIIHPEERTNSSPETSVYYQE